MTQGNNIKNRTIWRKPKFGVPLTWVRWSLFTEAQPRIFRIRSTISALLRKNSFRTTELADMDNQAPPFVGPDCI